MWFLIWTGGDSVMDRPLCVLVHYLLGINLLCLIAAQGLALALLGPHATVGFAWLITTVVLILAHTAFAFLFAWIDGEEFRIGVGAESEGDSGSGPFGGGGSSGDGSGAS